MVTKLVKDIIGAVFMSLGVLCTLAFAAAGCVSLFEENIDAELAFVPKEKEKK